MNKSIKLVDTNPIPEIVQVMPSRWLFEGLYVAQAKLNPYDASIGSIDKQRQKIKKIKGPELLRQQNKIYKDIAIKTKKYPKEKYTNQYLSLSVSMMDGKYLNTNKNIFLSSYKTLFKKRYSTFCYNLLISLFYILSKYSLHYKIKVFL